MALPRWTVLEAMKEKPRQAPLQPQLRQPLAPLTVAKRGGDGRVISGPRPARAAARRQATSAARLPSPQHPPARPCPQSSQSCRNLPKPVPLRPLSFPPAGWVLEKKPAWPRSSVLVTHSDSHRFFLWAERWGTDYSFSKKALILSKKQISSQQRGLSRRGCGQQRGTGRGREGGTSFPLPAFCFPMFSLIPVRRQKMKSYVPSPPHQLEYFGGRVQFSAAYGQRRKKREHQEKAAGEALAFVQGSSRAERLAPAAKPLLSTVEGSLATSSKITPRGTQGFVASCQTFFNKWVSSSQQNTG